MESGGKAPHSKIGGHGPPLQSYFCFATCGQRLDDEARFEISPFYAARTPSGVWETAAGAALKLCKTLRPFQGEVFFSLQTKGRGLKGQSRNKCRFFNGIAKPPAQCPRFMLLRCIK